MLLDDAADNVCNVADDDAPTSRRRDKTSLAKQLLNDVDVQWWPPLTTTSGGANASTISDGLCDSDASSVVSSIAVAADDGVVVDGGLIVFVVSA